MGAGSDAGPHFCLGKADDLPNAGLGEAVHSQRGSAQVSISGRIQLG
jgi:hypothetical protein